MKLFIYYLSIVTAIGACTSTASKLEEEAASVKVAHVATTIKIHPAEIKPFHYQIHTKGKVYAKHSTVIYPRATGVLTALYVHTGDWVKKGALLATIANEQQQIELQQAEVLLDKRMLEFQNECVSFFSGSHLGDSARNAIRKILRIRKGVPEAELQVKKAQLNFEFTKIRANQSGIVADLTAKLSHQVRMDQVFCALYDPSQLQIETQVLESEVNKLAIGQMATVSTLSDQTQALSAQVSEINPMVDAKTGMINIKLDIDKGARLLPGMNVAAVINVPYEEHLIVPKEALLIRSGKHVIFVEEEGLAKWKYVTIGMENHKEVEVLEGLVRGDKVITSNNLQLAHDSPVVYADQNK